MQDVLTQLAAICLAQGEISRGLLLLAYSRPQTRSTYEVRDQAGQLWNLHRDQVAPPTLAEAVAQAQRSTLAQMIAIATADVEPAQQALEYVSGLSFRIAK